jgi:deazaflavin-dependent oxidoreductase (nitroreductase family)
MAVAEFTRALQDTEEIELTVTGRGSGRKSTRPVWFVADGDTLYLLPVKGSDSEWFENVLKNPTATLAAGGATWTARATPITDPAAVRQVVERFRARYGADQVAKYYTKFDVAVKVPLA